MTIDCIGRLSDHFLRPLDIYSIENKTVSSCVCGII